MLTWVQLYVLSYVSTRDRLAKVGVLDHDYMSSYL